MMVRFAQIVIAALISWVSAQAAAEEKIGTITPEPQYAARLVVATRSALPGHPLLLPFRIVEGEVVLFELDRPFKEVVIGAEGSKVVSANNQGGRAVSIAGEKPGFASVLVLDEQANEIARADVTVEPRSVQRSDAITVDQGGVTVQDFYCNPRTGCVDGDVRRAPPPVIQTFTISPTPASDQQ